MDGKKDENMALFNGEVVVREKLNSDVYRIGVKLDGKFPAYKQGNFVMAHLKTGIDPMLPRPFSIFNIKGNQVELIFRLVGKGTKMLAKTPLPVPVKLWGPLGNSFPVKSGRNVMVAGGLGIIPLFNLQRDIYFDKIFAGFRTKNEAFMLKELNKSAAVIATDDGSLGNKGFVTELFEEYMKDRDAWQTNVYLCGPLPFMKRMWELGNKHKKVTMFGSFETRMACGFGVCLGCSIETPKGMVKVCKDGPVFNLSEIFGARDES